MLDETVVRKGRKSKRQKQLEEFNNKISRVAFIMPEPSDASRNTQILQSYLNIAKENNVQVTVLFKNGNYKLNTCIIYSNTNIIFFSNLQRNTFGEPELAHSHSF